MAPRKKGKQSSPEREATDAATPWPDIPRELNSEVARQSTLMNDFSYGGVTKSWTLSSSNHCNPKAKLPPLSQLSDITGGIGGTHNISYAFFDILFRGGECWWYPWGITPEKCQTKHHRFHFEGHFNSASEYDVGIYWHFRFKITPREYYTQYRRFQFRGYSHGVLVGIKGTYPRPRHHLWDPMTDFTWILPYWDENLPFKYVALSSSPLATNSCLVVVVTGMSKPAFLFYGFSRGNSEWIKQDCNILDPHSSNPKLMEFTDIIAFQEKFYALSLQGTLVVVEADTDSELRITDLGKTRAIPNVHSKCFKEYFLESNEEILLVFLISRKFINVVDSVEVYRLQFDRLAWEKLERLGDRTLFMGRNCGACIVSSRVGFKGNCIYFSHGSVDRWHVYDMKTQIISLWLVH